MGDFNLAGFLTAAVLAGVPLLFGTLGEILTEKSGNLNLGVEGMMFMGAVGGLAGPYFYEQVGGTSQIIAVLLGLVLAFLCAAFGAFLYSVLTITLRANQNVTGLALTIFGTGFANFFGEAIGSTNASNYMSVGKPTVDAFNNGIMGLKGAGGVGDFFASMNFMVVLGLLLAGFLAWFLGRSRKGLNLRSVGESPATADAAGINVTAYKYLATVLGGGICGLGGLYIVMNAPSGAGGTRLHNCVGGRGWIAVALVIFATWSPTRAILGSLVFGALSIMRLYINLGIPAQIYSIFPYIATVIVLIAVSMRRKRENQPPNSLGLAYFREER